MLNDVIYILIAFRKVWVGRASETTNQVEVASCQVGRLRVRSHDLR